MTMSSFPNGFNNGVSVRGMPILSAYSGNILWVDSGPGVSGDGTFTRPFSTIEEAFNSNKITASNGDIVMVKAGHAETVSAAAGIDMDIAGVTVVGLGNGSNRPTITFDTAATADIDIDAANITIENIVFSANFADIAAAIDVNAVNFTLRGCHFQATAVDMNFKICVQDGATTTSNGITVEGCTSLMLDAADTHFINMAGTGDGHMIRDNVLSGNWGTMCIGGAGLVTRCSILNNYIFNIASDADACINMGATATGICANNRCAGGHATDGIVPGDLGSVENYYVLSTAALSGVIEPAIA